MLRLGIWIWGFFDLHACVLDRVSSSLRASSCALGIEKHGFFIVLRLLSRGGGLL